MSGAQLMCENHPDFNEVFSAWAFASVYNNIFQIRI